MTSFRGYAIRNDGRIKRGAYLAAETALQAHDAAIELCEEDVQRVEVWADARKIDEVECHDSDEVSGGASPSKSAS